MVAVLSQEDQRLLEEVAGLTYHTLIPLSARGLTPADVVTELKKRHRNRL